MLLCISTRTILGYTTDELFNTICLAYTLEFLLSCTSIECTNANFGNAIWIAIGFNSIQKHDHLFTFLKYFTSAFCARLLQFIAHHLYHLRHVLLNQDQVHYLHQANSNEG